MQGMIISIFPCDSCLQHIWSIPPTSWQTGLRVPRRQTEPQGPKILCLIDMFPVFFQTFFHHWEPRLHMVSLVHLLTFETWRVEMEPAFFEDLWRFFCARLGLNTACKDACTVQKCAKYIKHFSILIRDISRCFSLGLNLKENWKLHERLLSLRVTAKQRLQRNEWFKDMGRDNPDQGLQIHHEGTVHQNFSAKQESKKNMHCQFFQCFSSLDFAYGTLVRFLSRMYSKCFLFLVQFMHHRTSTSHQHYNCKICSIQSIHHFDVEERIFRNLGPKSIPFFSIRICQPKQKTSDSTHNLRASKFKSPSNFRHEKSTKTSNLQGFLLDIQFKPARFTQQIFLEMGMKT